MSERMSGEELERLLTSDLKDLSPMELYHRRISALGELGRLDLEMARRQTGRRHLRADELEWVASADATVTASTNRYCQVVSPELGFDIHNIQMFMVEIAPGTTKGTHHRHGDAIKHYLSGRAIEHVGDEVFEVAAGDFLHVPANAWHETLNPYDEPCRFLAAQQFAGTYTQVPTPFLDSAQAPLEGDGDAGTC
jgi:quercetin dioxygenase-like cupin family protein